MEFLPADCRTLIFAEVNPYDWDVLRAVSKGWDQVITELADLRFTETTKEVKFTYDQARALKYKLVEAMFEVESRTATVCTVIKYYGGDFVIMGIGALPVLISLTIGYVPTSGMFFAGNPLSQFSTARTFQGMLCCKGLAPGHIREILKQL